MTLTAADRIEIAELVARYNWTIDHFEAEAWADVFTPDGALLVNGETRAQGHAALVAYLAPRRAAGLPKIRHWPSNLIIEGAGDTARLRAYVMAFMITDGLEAPYVMGEYDDTLVRLEGAWKFKLRHLTVVAGRSATGRPQA